MTVEKFIKKWRHSINYLGLPSVGIHVGWDLIPSDTKVNSFSGKEAWEKVYNCTTPWFKKPRTFIELFDSKDMDYHQIVKEETENGKIDYYRQNGLREPFFCAFANQNGPFMLLGDGNHRFFDCVYLLREGFRDFEEDSKRATLDIIYLKNFDEVMRPDTIWGNWNDYRSYQLLRGSI